MLAMLSWSSNGLGYSTAVNASALRIEHLVRRLTAGGMPRYVAFRFEAFARTVWQLLFGFVDLADVRNWEDVATSVLRQLVGGILSLATACWTVSVCGLLVFAG